MKWRLVNIRIQFGRVVEQNDVGTVSNETLRLYVDDPRAQNAVWLDTPSMIIRTWLPDPQGRWFLQIAVPE